MNEGEVRKQVQSLLSAATDSNPKNSSKRLAALKLIKSIAEAVKKNPQDPNVQLVAKILSEEMKKMLGTKAKLGAKLNYISQLKGNCPEGEHLVYFKKGGKTCKACEGKKLENGAKLNPVEEFKRNRKNK